jgi:hypothetical protein
MGLSKLLEHSMNALGIFSLKMILKLEKPTPLYSLEEPVTIYLFAKYMSMILYLVLLTKLAVMSLVKQWSSDLRCL